MPVYIKDLPEPSSRHQCKISLLVRCDGYSYYHSSHWCGTVLTLFYLYTVKPQNKGHPREQQVMVLIDKWFLFGCYFFYLIYKAYITVWSLFIGGL